MTADLMLCEAIKGFILARTADGCSPSTIEQYRWALDRLASRVEKPIKEITLEDLRGFLAWLHTEYKPTRPNKDQSPLSGASMFAAWKSIKAFYSWVSAELGIPRVDRIPRPRFSSPEVRPFTEDEVHALIKAADKTVLAETKGRKAFSMRRPTALRDKAIVLVLLDTGLRVGELCRLRIQDVNLESGEVRVQPFRSSLKSRPRTVPIGSATRRAVWRYLSEEKRKPNDLLFLSAEEKPMNRTSARQMLNRLGQRAGVQDCHPHKFRHSFAILFLRNGGDVFTLQRLLGHSSLEMVRHYLAIAQSDLETAHRRASPVDNWRL